MRTFATTMFLGFGLSTTLIACAPSAPVSFDADGWVDDDGSSDDGSGSDGSGSGSDGSSDDGSGSDGSGSGSDGSGSDDGSSSSDDWDLEMVFSSPGNVVYGTAWCHVEFVDDLQSRLDDGDWAGWIYTTMQKNVNTVSINANPGWIEGVRSNCTWCPGDLDTEPYGSYAESMGCTWSAYGSSESESRLQGAVSAIFDGYSYTAGTVFVAGGTSVLHDFR